MTRLDKRGRKIGYNWWRDMNVTVLSDAEDAWQRRRESDEPAPGAPGAAHSQIACYQLDDDEYRALFPRPTLKAYLLENAGMACRQA